MLTPPLQERLVSEHSRERRTAAARTRQIAQATPPATSEKGASGAALAVMLTARRLSHPRVMLVIGLTILLLSLLLVTGGPETLATPLPVSPVRVTAMA